MSANINAYLQNQVEVRGGNIALRFKKQGVWQQRTWSDILQVVKHQAWSLQKQGFEAGHRARVDAELNPETLYQILAIQWLGGTAVPALHHEDSDTKRFPSQTEWDEGGAEWNQTFAALNPDHPILEVQDPNHEWQIYRLGEWTRRSDQLVIQAQLHDRDDVFAGPFWEIILPWLISGSRLHIPEHPETVEGDRSEIAPTLILESSDFYASWLKSIQSRLPESGLGSGPQSWLARRRLRRVLGLHRLRVALILDEVPSDEIRDFFAALDVFIERTPLPHAWASPETISTRSRWAQGLFEAQNEVLDQYKVIL